MKCKYLSCGLIMMLVFQVQAAVALAALGTSSRITWPLVADAVVYELEVTDRYFPADGAALPSDHVIEDLTVATAGKQLALNSSQNAAELWWRVRALDALGNPLTAFSDLQPLAKGELNAQSPLPVMSYPDDFAVPLYPVYSWIPVPGAAGYDVEVLNAPLMPNENSQSVQRIERYHIGGEEAFDCYDLHSYTAAGTYYWRVRAVDDLGRALGSWSAVTAFHVVTEGYAVAALGDSITQGGGAISSPPGTPIYDWTRSVTVPVKNLGRSGDTTEALLERFDQDVLPFHPAILIIAGGINDIRDGSEASQIIGNLQNLRQKCLDWQITPVFLTIAPVNPERVARFIGHPLPPYWRNEWQAVNNWILNQPNAVDTASLLMNAQGVLPERLSADGLHPDSEGKRLIGQAVSKKIYDMQNPVK